MASVRRFLSSSSRGRVVRIDPLPASFGEARISHPQFRQCGQCDLAFSLRGKAAAAA